MIMNVIFGDSRAKALIGCADLQGLTDIHYRPGGDYKAMSSMVTDYYSHHGIQSDDTRYYIFAGICDVTERIHQKVSRYQEVVYFEHPHKTLSRVSDSIMKLHVQIRNLGATAVFSTICPMDICKWNTVRKTQRKTSYLRYMDLYASMQSALNEAIDLINTFIINLNVASCVKTPAIHRCLQHNHKNGSKSWRLHKLTDGCHFDKDLSDKVAQAFVRAMHLNGHSTFSGY